MKKHQLLVVILGLGACAGCDGGNSTTVATGGTTSSPGTGGAVGKGGSQTTGGSPSSGGTTAMGGVTSAGGSSSSGGATVAGGSTNVTGTGGSAGVTASGGVTSSGGSTSAGGAQGGNTSAGGSSNSGGATATGGKTGAGGSSGSGGATGGAAGGTKATGGSSSSGGAAGGAAGGTKATGGSISSGGATGGSTSGNGGNSGVCSFASGLNVAWVNFAGDVPNPNLTTFNTIFKNTYAAGGRVIRWWFHTNGTVTPGYDSTGLTVKIPQTHIDGVKAILNAAATNKVAINISLWSFDMLQGSENISTATMAANKSLLENDTNRQAYVDNYLTPLVTALKGTPGLYSYEIFNEPEGMGPSGWATGGRTTEAYIQKTVNWLAAAIHTADPTALVTNGAQTFDYCSGVSGKNNYYSDSALRGLQGAKQNGTLDFYEVHYYTSNGASNSCFTYPASHWALDKKLVMGEFAAAATDGTALTDLYTKIYSTGYNGAWAWSYDADWPWPDMQTPMQNLYTAQQTVVNSCP
jgi:hypothetical protein